ncbi:hypothetical protein CK203_056357 [Vitis vinifera]|uniref:Uncharacterized protein n=1 Tax=Vitis vinifera TaxID=29760 RepID=A0A438GL37_VITVI|nr:hypothetical protein CK203_056357 [Vitis vinifera]
MSILLPNHSATLWILARIFAAAKASLAHECHFAAQDPHFAVAKAVKSPISQQSPIPQGISQLRKRFWHTCATSQHSYIHFACETHCEVVAKMAFAAKLAFFCETKLTLSLPLFISFLKRLTAQASGHLLRSSIPANFRQPEMARTRGAKSSSPSSRKKSLRKKPVPDPFLSLRSQEQFPPPGEIRAAKASARRYLTRAFAGSNSSSSPVLSPVPSSVPSPALQAKPQEPQPPLPEPQIPSETAPERVIKRPMLTQPPIEGNLDCRARPFHSELCFDIAAFRLQSKLAQSFNLLRRYHMEHLLTPRDFFLPQGSHGFLSIHDNQTGCFAKFWNTWGILLSLSWSAKRICRELFTLDKWNNMTTYRVDQPERPQPAARRASPRHIPEGITVAAPAIPKAPPAASTSSQPSTSVEPRMTIPISEYRELCRSLETLTDLRAVLLKRWQPLKHAKSRCWPLRLNTLPS